MFWDKAAVFYDLFEDMYNGKVNKKLCYEVENLIDSGDRVLECACGTGMLSKYISVKAKTLIATDFSDGMLNRARKKCRTCKNIKFKKADIMNLKCKEELFDKVVAGNVIHLLNSPKAAVEELMRVCKKGGKVIIPTYINNESSKNSKNFIKLLEKLGADFKQQFNYESYKEFFADMGYKNVEYRLVEGKMPCAVAIILKD